MSTDSDEQYTSYEAQVDYYQNYIQSREDWEFVGIYTDEGITGTNTKRREGFKRMIADALDGKIDLIVTKSVSRFARNTVDSLTTIRQLKERGCECFFEKENIWTFDSKGELLITIMSSLAQEESRSISENCTWGQRKRFADGKVTVPFRRFLGYDRGPKGELVVNKEQAEIVKRIYALYLEGKGFYRIATILNEEGIRTATGKANWHQGSIKSILTNEKYKGDALLQKSFTVNFLTKEKKINEGEIPQYYVKNNHEAIIDPEVWDEVQRQIELRQSYGRKNRTKLFSCKIRCGNCGGFYGAVTWHAGSKYEKDYWQCLNKYQGKRLGCKTPHVSDEQLKAIVVNVINRVLENKNEITSHFREVGDTLFDIDKARADLAKAQGELQVTETLLKDLIESNARISQDQDAYETRYQQLAATYETQEREAKKAEQQLLELEHKRYQVESFLKRLEQQDHLLTEFDPTLFYALVEHITVHAKDDIRVMFKNGMEI